MAYRASSTARDARSTREHDGFGVGGDRLGLGDDFDAVQPRHVKIDQDAVVGVAFQGGCGHVAIGANGDVMTEPWPLMNA